MKLRELDMTYKNPNKKNYILAIAILLLFISCKKSEKPIESEKMQDSTAMTPKQSKIKEVETSIYNYEINSDYSEEMDFDLLAKVAMNLKIIYENIKIDDCSSINYSNKISFFVITYLPEAATANDEDSGNYYTRIYVFVNKKDGGIIAKEIDKNLSYYDDEVAKPGKTEIFKKLIHLNETTKAIALSTEFDSGSQITLWSAKKLTIVTLDNKIINKILYEYPIRKTQGDSNGGGSFKMEVLETTIIVSKTKTNGLFDLNVTKTFSYEKEVEEDLEKGIKGSVAPIKYKKEVEKISFNGTKYFFKTDENYRFLKI